MTEFEYKRIAYIIKQAEKGTYVCVGKGDASILSKLVKDYKEKLKWEKTLTLVREELNAEKEIRFDNSGTEVSNEEGRD